MAEQGLSSSKARCNGKDCDGADRTRRQRRADQCTRDHFRPATPRYATGALPLRQASQGRGVLEVLEGATFNRGCPL